MISYLSLALEPLKGRERRTIVAPCKNMFDQLKKFTNWIAHRFPKECKYKLTFNRSNVRMHILFFITINTTM